MKKGIVQIYTGDAKGKTSAALGCAFRALGHGFKICIIQFLKTSKRYGELHTAENIPNIEIVQIGRPCSEVDDQELKSIKEIMELQNCDNCLKCHINPDNPSKADFDFAKKGLQLAIEKAENYDMIILDEIFYAINFNLLTIDEVEKFINDCPENVDLILTGRDAPSKLIEIADMVTEMSEVKHHLQKGISARAGIEY